MGDRTEVMFLASNPFREGAPARLHEEVRGIGSALREAPRRVELVPCYAARTLDLQEALMRHDPRIVHFAGHGDDRFIYLADASGRRGVVGPEALAEMFGFLSEWIKVVILNGSGTLPMVEALGEVVDYAIGMDLPLSDPSAMAFARAFYGAVGTGEPVEASFGAAVRVLEGGTMPVLRVRCPAAR